MFLSLARIKYPVYIIVVLISLLFWLKCIYTDFRENAHFYYYLLKHKLEERRAAVNYRDFYRFIKICDDSIPKNEDIAWVFNKEDIDLSRSLAKRAHYYLLPRTFRREANYIIVYELAGYRKDGYGVFKEFAPGKLILQRKRQ